MMPTLPPLREAMRSSAAQKQGVSVADPDAKPNTAMATNYITRNPVGAWVLPVVGMMNAPGKFQAGGPAQWSAGSFGYQKPMSKGGHVHKGADIYADRGTGVVAPVAGTIKSTGKSDISGNYVKVQGDDGYEYYYAHLDSVHSGITSGMRVGAGAYLGGVGNTGNASGTSTHLHFEIRKGGQTVNPNDFFQSGTQQPTTPLSAIAGLNTVEEIQAYIDEEIRRANVLAGGAEGFDPATWNQQGQQLSEEDMIAEQTAKGQNILGSTLTAMSNSIGGGQRTPMQRNTTALEATSTAASQGGQTMTPQAEDLRPDIEEEVA